VWAGDDGVLTWGPVAPPLAAVHVFTMLAARCGERVGCGATAVVVVGRKKRRGKQLHAVSAFGRGAPRLGYLDIISYSYKAGVAQLARASNLILLGFNPWIWHFF